MITHTDARQMIRQRLDSFEEEHRETDELQKDLTPAEREILGIYPVEDFELVILDDLTIEREFGWVFFWTSKKYKETGALEHALAGNAPFLISRKDGRLHETGTLYPTEYYIENFIRCGGTQGKQP